ncbi:unnamed protein product [Closterium sp. NIES-53]
MTLRPSTAPLRVPLPSPPASSLPVLADPVSDSLRAASPTVTRLLSTVVTDPSLESTAVSALVAELVDFAARCRLDYPASLVAESASVCPPSVGGECALSTDVLEDRQEEFQCFAAALPHLVSTLIAPEGDPDAPDIPTPRSYAEAMEGPYYSQWLSAMDTEMASWKSTGTYVDEVPPPGANIVSGMWIFRVKRPPGSPPVFKVRYVARGSSQRKGVDYFQNFSPTLKMTTLRVLLHVAAQRDYELHSLDFSTAFLQGSLHEEIWLRRPPGFTGSFPPGTQWSLQRPVYGLRQAPREWHNTVRTTLAALGFAPSTADPSPFLLTDTSLPPFYILVYVEDLVFATADTAGLAHVKSELQKRHTCTDRFSAFTSGVTQHGECPADRLWHLTGDLRGDPWSSFAGSLRSTRRCGDDFGGGVSELLSPFIARHGPGGNREVKVEGIDSDGRPVRFKFVLHKDELEEFEGPGTHDGCVEVCTQFAEVIVHQLEHRLGDLNGMSGARLFTPDEYSLERGERNRRCLEWLQLLVTLFKADLTDEILPGIDKRRAEKELRMFTSVLAASTKGERSFHAGLTAMLKTPDWRENYPNLVLLWVAVAVLPLSTVECERGFSRQNIIKSWKRGALKDARLGDLMCMSLMDYAPDWDEIVTVWRSYKKRKPQSNAPLPPAGKQRNKKVREVDEEMDVVVDLEDEQDAVDFDDDDGFNE